MESPGRAWPYIGFHPFISGKELSLDTGAGYGGPLTACDVFSEKIWQAWQI